ncbi:MAG TPA: diguanylate cyclase [Candidatus Omnitrophica bacterium]|nr:diguanylate cyclase [Candidatus Omnitrophota bacterium]
MKKKQTKNKKVKQCKKKTSLAANGYGFAINAGKSNELDMELDRALFRDIIDVISDILIVIDPCDYSILTANKKYLQKEGFSLKDIRGKKCYEITHKRSSPCMPPKDTCPMQETIKTGEVARAEHTHYDGKGKPYFSEVITYPVFDSRKKIKAIVHISRDITESRKIEDESRRYMQRLKELTLRDPHTGLYNYRYLMDRLSAEIELCKRHYFSLSLLIIDIDYFKSINDVYGHQIGDRVLLELSGFIKNLLRKSDTLTRYGGEEFVVVMPQATKRNALNTANRIIEQVNKHIFKIGNVSIKIRVSIGISEFSRESKLTETKEIFDAADKALQRAKETGGNRTAVFSALYKDKKKRSGKINYKEEVEILKRKITKLGQRVDQAVLESMYAFSKSLEARDYYTAEHADRMIAIASDIGKKIGLNKNILDNLEKAAVLHDIGKIGISDEILRKKGKLTPEEYKIIKTHPQIGAEIIRAVHFLKDVVPIVLHHHERLDGMGYPSHLKNGEIPLCARIIAIADAYQALTSDRPYRKAFSKKKAFQILKEEAGAHFDKKIVDTLIRIEKKKT